MKQQSKGNVMIPGASHHLARIEDKWQQAMREYERNTVYIREVVKGISILGTRQNTSPVVELIEVPPMAVLSTRRMMEPHETMVFAGRYIELYNICETQRLHYHVGAYAINHCSYLSQFSQNSIDLETLIPLKSPPPEHPYLCTFGGFHGGPQFL